MKRIFGIILLLMFVSLACMAEVVTIFDFEDGLDGFGGKVALSSQGATSGKKALEIDCQGASGWIQDLDVAQGNLPDFSNANGLMLDVTVPQGVMVPGSFLQIIPTFSGPKNSFLQVGKQDLKEGLNRLQFRLRGSEIGTPKKIFLIFNSGSKLGGKIYVDNIRMLRPGKPMPVAVEVKDLNGKPVTGAFVAMGKEAVITNARGQATLKVGSDHYQAEIQGDGLVTLNQDVEVKDGSNNHLVFKVTRKKVQKPADAQLSIQFGKILRAFDAHKVYGNNIAIWNGVAPFKDPVSVQRLNDARINFLRFPGGDYGNVWDWRSGKVFKSDGTLDWIPDVNWQSYVALLKQLPGGEMLMIANIFLLEPQDALDWIGDAKAKGIPLRYVELGNEPDLKPDVPHKGMAAPYWTKIDNYISEYLRFAKAIRAKYPDIKLMGPCISQIGNRESLNGKPWESQNDATKPFWMEEFIKKCGDYVDVLSFHSYPYYTMGAMEPEKLFDTTNEFKIWIPQWKAWLKKYQPQRADKIEIAMTEYNVQVAENVTTASLINGVFLANFLGEYIKNGGDIANYWDTHTVKPGEGGGHGMLDMASDPTRPYAQRASYWSMKMLANGFSGELVEADSNAGDVPVYAAKDGKRKSILVINRNPERGAVAKLDIQGLEGSAEVSVQRLSAKEYLWSPLLYRAVLNSGPTKKFYGPLKEGKLSLPLEPLSVNLVSLQ